VHSVDGCIEESLAFRFPFSPLTIVKAKRRQCLYQLVYTSKEKERNEEKKKESFDEVDCLLFCSLVSFSVLFCSVIANSNKIEKPETSFSSSVLSLMVFRSFGIFICADYVSLYITYLLPHLHVIYFADIASFTSYFFFFFHRNSTRKHHFLCACMCIYLCVDFFPWLRSMSSTCGEIEIFPILLIRLPSSSFHLN
jgi:hypothetical protein